MNSIAGNLKISGNDALVGLTGLNNVVSVGGDLTISWNDALTSLTSLNNLSSIGGYLSIPGNDALTSLTGLDNLTSIEGFLWIGGNDVLTNLSGLDNLTIIGGDLMIGGYNFNYGNPELTSLAGLDNVTSIGGDLTITYNYSLTTCDVQSICNYLENPNGEIEIHDNSAGCNTQGLVEEACATVTAVEINKVENYSIYPNPVSDIATFSTEEITSFELYDIMGVLIISRKSNKVDMSNLNPGIYFAIGFDKHNFPLYKGKIVKK